MSQRTLRRSSLVAAVSCAVILAACSGNGDGEESPPADPFAEEMIEQGVEETAGEAEDVDTEDVEEPAEEPAPETDETPEAGEDAEEADQASGSASGMSRSELQAMFTGLTPGPARVVYDFEGPGAEDIDSFTIAQDGDRQATSASGPTGGFFSLIDGDIIVVCGQEQEWECFSLDAGDEDMFGFGDLFLAEDLFDDIPDFEDEQVDITDISETTIIGRDAVCISATDPETGEGGEFCLDRATGILLRVSTEEAGVPFNLSAVEFSTPTSDDFAPPAEPVSIADMMGG